MKLTEHEGKKLFTQHGIAVPESILLTQDTQLPETWHAGVVKAQVLTGDRLRNGGILFANTREELVLNIAELFKNKIQGEPVSEVLVEERVTGAEAYVSISYSDEYRAPVIALSPTGGTGADSAHIVPIDITNEFSLHEAQEALRMSGFSEEEAAQCAPTVLSLWNLFLSEYALLAEINPLFITADKVVAGDAKVIIDDEKVQPGMRRYIEMDGDIAILASGGGASMLNIDALLQAGGKPANYTEYSGNPAPEEVKGLTIKTLSKKGLRGCWVVGAAANFTDIHATLSGFLEGLRALPERPRYPIVIRRDGPRKDEAFALLQEAAKKEGYDFHLYDSQTPMIDTASIMVELSKKN